MSNNEADRLADPRDCFESIKRHLADQPSALATAVMATCDAGLAALAKQRAPEATEQRQALAEDASYLKAVAANLSYNDERFKAVRKHRLNEIAMRLESGYYSAALASTTEATAGPASGAAVFLVATGEEHEGLGTYTRHEGAPPPLCDFEGPLYATRATAEPAAVPVAGEWRDHPNSIDVQWFVSPAGRLLAEVGSINLGGGAPYYAAVGTKRLDHRYVSRTNAVNDVVAALAAQGTQKAEQQASPQAHDREAFEKAAKSLHLREGESPRYHFRLERDDETGEYVYHSDHHAWELWKIATASPPKAEATQALGDWRIDHSAGRPILVYKDCSVLEAEQAYYVLSLLKAAHASQEATQAAAGGEAEIQNALDATLGVCNRVIDQWHAIQCGVDFRALRGAIQKAQYALARMPIHAPPSPAQSPEPNSCKLTECQGQPRCKRCLARDTRNARATEDYHAKAYRLARELADHLEVRPA